MFASSKITFAGIVAVVAGVVSAAPNPTEPSSTSVFNVGSTCSIKWNVDATGAWKKMNIQLMTGDNWNMVHLTTVAQNIDATDATKNSFTYTCPEVTPTSAIYFYQFTDPSAPKELLWTTRFTLAAADGSTTPPSESTQPNGDSIPWGKGALVDPSTAVAAPAYLGGNQAGTVSPTASGSVSATPAGSSSAPVTTPVASPPPTRSTSASGSVVTSVARASNGAPSASGSAAASSPSTNAAIGGVVPGMMVVVGAVFAAAGMI